MIRPVLYDIIWVILVVSTALELMALGQDIPFSTIVAMIIALSAFKVFLIAAFFMHLIYEPKAVVGLMLFGLAVFITLLTGLAVS